MNNKYKKEARKAFDKALVKFNYFRENILKSVGCDSAKGTKEIDKFAEDLGFNIYCEEFMASIIDYTGYKLAANDEHKNDYLALTTLVTSHYLSEHKDVVSDGFKELCVACIRTFELNMLIDIWESL